MQNLSIDSLSYVEGGGASQKTLERPEQQSTRKSNSSIIGKFKKYSAATAEHSQE